MQDEINYQLSQKLEKQAMVMEA